MDRRYDPRSIVTPYAFAVHPDLLGRPLATPMQRLGAILIDLVVIFFLAKIGASILALASALLLFWLAFRKPGRDVFGKLFRIAVGCLGFMVLAIAIIVVTAIRYGPQIERWLADNAQDMAAEAGVNLEGVPGVGEQTSEPGLREAFRAVTGAVAFSNAETADEARDIAFRLAQNGQELNMPRAQIRATLQELIPEDAPWVEEAQGIIDETMGRLEEMEGAGEGAIQGDPERSGAVAGPEGVVAETEETAEAAITEEAALDSIAALSRVLQDVVEERDDAREALERTREELEEAQNSGLFAWLWNFIDELGLGFGWGALYLTITHAWWKGTSVGKKLFRIRVVMIDKRPLNWWLSFERAGGYAAGFATGLLGFAQIFWDPNRQAIHDKVSETIVIQDGKQPVPGPWMEEGKALWRRGQFENSTT